MGLDMYLSKRTYVGNKWRKPEQQLKVVFPESEEDVSFPVHPTDINQSKISEIEEEVAYWRKANQIHEWFVQNVQEGEDDCKDHYVDMEKIEELVKLCKTVLEKAKTNIPIPDDTSDWQAWTKIVIKNKKALEELLPTAEGFFFGGTEYNGDYLYELKQTVEQLEPLTEKGEDGYYKCKGELVYKASW